jgi:hypothetical protein
LIDGVQCDKWSIFHAGKVFMDTHESSKLK